MYQGDIDYLEYFINNIYRKHLQESKERMNNKRVKIKESVDPTDKRVGTIVESEKYRQFIKWSDTCQRWEYKANLEQYIPPVVVGSRVTVAGQYVTGGDMFGHASITPAVAKVVYLHTDGRAAVIFESGSTLGVVYIKELEVLD